MRPEGTSRFVVFLAALLLAAHLAPTSVGAVTAHQGLMVFTLRSGIADGRMVFLGVGGDIDGKVNPDLVLREGEMAQINLINGEGAEHDIVIDFYGVRSNRVVGKGASATVSFLADKTGSFAYFCAIPGHRESGMLGKVRVEPGKRISPPPIGADITRDPSDVPPPVHRGPKTVRFDLKTIELKGRLDDNTSYQFWTFGGKIPGPFLRARLGDMVEVHLHNDQSSVLAHSIDMHGAIGPGGGAQFTQTNPGEETVVSFKATTPGLFVYHCATPSIANHIANGMYGLLLVEPEGGLPEVDREFYVMQGELYTTKPFGAAGEQEMSYEKLVSERPEYFVFNGAVGALAKEYALRARLGETVRIFFGVGGPNFPSSFHIVGEIFERVRTSFSDLPRKDAQTVSVPPGGAAILEFKARHGGRYALVDHAMSRAERGLEGALIVEGPVNDSLMHQGPASRSSAKREDASR
ncbi:copper-containing nitrite reductase [Methylocystis sp. IM3]|uniref:copper-containing nitrite reductase n=1 Tax=unclassified Methylocystis TaxID=2625913 RepID=UPI000FA8DE15|nr:MAG: nitrite reductase, copper-containing [Hyphomicrobiales bacterium]